MKIFKVTLSGLITIALIYSLNRSWNFGSPIPPVAKFLDPFHGFWQNAQSAAIPGSSLTSPGLKNEVTIIYDSLLVPHIYAANTPDLYFAQGFITAQNRLWQMEFQTHAGAGRISEIIGSATLDYDRKQRRLGMVFAAQNALAIMEKDSLALSIIGNYTKGINAYIQTLSYDKLPIEYKLLDYKPEPWTNLKVALLLKNMAQTLNMREDDLEMTNALKTFGKETLDLLFPDYQAVPDPIVDNSGKWTFKPITLQNTPPAFPNQLVRLKPLEKSPPDIGSNNWAVAGIKTATGSPILANDPHLELNLPSIWYIVHLNAPGINAMGASLPGAPCVVSGFNDSIAWGETNAQRDLVDWYKVKFKDNHKNEYLSDSIWKPTRKVIEKFIIKGKEPFYDTVVYTHHGPVTFDESYHSENEKNLYAFRWLSHDPSMEIITFHKLNQARNHRQYMEALDHYISPAQNFVFASVSGDVAMRIQGRYPVRRKEEGKFILDGTKTSTEWQAYIPNDQNIQYKNPLRGFVSSANQYPVDNTYPYYIQSNIWESYRNRRINQLLTKATEITPQDMINMQADNFNLKASESLPLFLTLLDSASLKGEESIAYQKIKNWDYINNVQSEAAAYYDAWLRSFVNNTWDEMLTSKSALPIPSDYMTLRFLHEKPDLSFFDIVGTPQKETSKDVVRLSFTEGVKQIVKWKEDHKKEPTWADYKDSYIQHLSRLPAFSEHVSHGGGSGLIDAHSRRNGPSWRMVVSLEKTGIRAWGVYPGGQSGNPGSPYYNNLLAYWVKDQNLPLLFVASPGKLKAKALATITLKP